MSKLWFVSDGTPYHGEDPNYYKPQEYPWAVDMENHWSEIKPQVIKFIDEREKAFSSNANHYKGLGSSQWTSLTFSFWGVKVSGSLEKDCPALAAHLAKIPGLVSVSFSQLAPQSSIDEHRGNTNAIFRCHYGIEVPEGLPNCGFRVNGEDRGWEEGKWLFFNDAQKHTAWNKTNKRRILLIIDVVRPEFLSKQKTICAKQIAARSFSKRPYLKNLPSPIRRLAFGLVTTLMRAYIPLFNLTK